MLKTLEKINKTLKDADIDEYQIYIYKDGKSYVYQDMFNKEEDKQDDKQDCVAIGFAANELKTTED